MNLKNIALHCLQYIYDNRITLTSHISTTFCMCIYQHVCVLFELNISLT